MRTPNRIDQLPAFIQELAWGIAPDLQPFPVRVALSSELPPSLAAPWASGYTSPRLPGALDRALGGGGKGGVALVLNDTLAVELVREACPGLPLARMEAIACKDLVGVAIHELAHIVGDEIPEPADDTEVGEFFQGMQTLNALLADCPERDQPEPSHEADFIRLGLHLVYRAEAVLGEPVARQSGFDAAALGVFDVDRYALALRYELTRLAGESFATIRATPPPPCFSALYQRDVKRRNQLLSKGVPK